MDLLEPDDVPLSVHEDIISYLRQQDLLNDDSEEFLQTITTFTEDKIRDILEELLQKFERNQKLKDDYEERVRAHNQYQLFNLKDVLPDFEISDEMYKNLTFRETVIIQHLTGIETEIRGEPIGGLCLDIQQALGQPPLQRNCVDIETKLARIMKRENKSTLNVEDINVGEDEPKVENEEADLEDSLDVQAKRNTDKFLVHLSSQFDVDGYNAGSTITSWVDRNLHTIEELRTEFYNTKPDSDFDELNIDVKQEFSLNVNRESDSSTTNKRKSKLKKDTNVKLNNGETDSILKKDPSIKSNKNSLKISKKEESVVKGSSIKSKEGVTLVSSKEDAKQSASKVTSKNASTSSSKKVNLSRTRSRSRDFNLKKDKKLERLRSVSLTDSFNQRRYSSSLQVLDEKYEKNQRDSLELPKTKLIQKNLYVGLQKKYYYVKHTCNADGIDDRKFYSLLKAKGYISEGANFVLQRYLAITIYIGTFELSTMYINGDMCRNIYNCTGPESQIVNGRRVDVCRIYRTVIEECGIEQRCMTILTLRGQIVHQTWEGVPYELQINPLLDVGDYAVIGNERVLLKHAWESDMQLLSKYLDEKVATDLKIKSYMIDHPEFRNMITDYIHAILLLKPEDIIEFTINHFLSFAPQFLPQNDYFINNY